MVINGARHVKERTHTDAMHVTQENVGFKDVFATFYEHAIAQRFMGFIVPSADDHLVARCNNSSMTKEHDNCQRYGDRQNHVDQRLLRDRFACARRIKSHAV